jgi:pyruvate dehydrogenase E1 component beta subunit
MTVREALNSALFEEMRREQKVFVIGEEVAQYEGAYKITKGLLKEFGSGRVIDTPITEAGFAGLATGAEPIAQRVLVEREIVGSRRGPAPSLRNDACVMFAAGPR